MKYILCTLTILAFATPALAERGEHTAPGNGNKNKNTNTNVNINVNNSVNSVHKTSIQHTSTNNHYKPVDVDYGGYHLPPIHIDVPVLSGLFHNLTGIRPR